MNVSRIFRPRLAAAILALALAASAFPALASSDAAGAPLLAGEDESAREVTALADGVVRTYIETPASSVYKQQKINVVEIDLSKRDLHFDVSYPGDCAAALETTNDAVTRFAAEHAGLTPVVAFNADMWMVDYAQARILGEGVTYLGYGDPVVKKAFPVSRSFNIVNGEIYTSETIPQETPFSGVSPSFGITDDYVPVLGNPSADVTLTGAGFSTYADGINRLPANDALIVYTDRVMGSVTDFALDDAYELVVDVGYDYVPCHGAVITGTVAEIYGPEDDGNPGPIDSTQLVLTARGERVADLRRFAVGDAVTLGISIVDLYGDDGRWQRVVNCVGGNFPLAVNGVPTHPLPLLDATYPATIVGSTKDGKLTFVTVDGRQSGYSDGLELYGSDQLMNDLGFYNALLLDGGGSTSIVVADGDGSFVTVNRPSDGRDRAVNDSVIISVGPERAAQGAIDIAVGSGIAADPVELVFDSRPLASSLLSTINEATASFVGDAVRLTAKDLAVNDPFVYIDYSRIRTKLAAEEYKYAALVYRVPETNALSGYGSEVFFNTNGQGARAGQSSLATVYRTDRYEVATFSAASLSEWKGTVSSLRLDFFGAAREGDEFYLRAIVFGKTQNEAHRRAKELADEANAAATVTVRFEMNGHGTQIAPVVLAKGTRLPEPAAPSEGGMVFAGWYGSPALDDRYDFASRVSKDVTLYARWAAALAGDANGDGSLNAADVRTIMRYAVGWAEDIVEANADANADGKLNSRDVLALMTAIISKGR